MVLVTLVMAMVAVLGYAMLSASSLQATAGANSVAAAVARAEAESGIHLAMYELLNGSVSAGGATWSNVTFSTTGTSPTTLPGSVTVQIGALTGHCCQIVSIGSSGAASGGGVVTRTITAEVQVGTPLVVNEAGGFNSLVSIGAHDTFTSATAGTPAIAAAGQIVTNLGQVNGNVTAGTFLGNAPSGGSVTVASSGTSAPLNGSVTNYTLPYVYQGTTCYPTLIGGAVNVTTILQPTTGNPLGIYYTAGNLTVSHQLTINGTLVVGGSGTLTTTSTINITAQSSQANCYLPALIVGHSILMTGANARLTATGVVYVNSGITGAGTNPSTNISINGALLITSNGISGTYTGTMAVNYNPTYTYVPTFDVVDWDYTSGIKIISWSE